MICVFLPCDDSSLPGLTPLPDLKHQLGALPPLQEETGGQVAGDCRHQTCQQQP